MEFFELTAADIAALDDGQLRELVARLAEAELKGQGLPSSSVHAGGAQEAADGGIDVQVEVHGVLTAPNFVPRADTGFQVKKHSMGRASCKKEMLENGAIRQSIKALVNVKGAYIIVSGKDSCSATMHADRIAGMEEALGDLPEDHGLALDFYGNDRLALWLKQHPGVALWVRQQLGKTLAGWRPYGRWAATPRYDDDTFLADPHPCVTDGSSRDKISKPVLDGIELTRQRLRAGDRAVRITGLSGVGKTRFAQALFEPSVGEEALPATDVLYADLGEELEPSASSVVGYLIANKLTPYVVLDNCPPGVHRALQKQLSGSAAPLHLLTIEYDISDDHPEETDVIHIEPSSVDTVAALLTRRYKKLDEFNAAQIAKFAGGNARLALALAERVDADETLVSFTDEQLFQRLFSQRKGESADLLRGATVLSLVYSFNTSRAEYGDELGVLAAISEMPRNALQRDQAELLRRHLAQQRGKWRAVLPQALATRLARRALAEYEAEDINTYLFKPENIRLFQSCAHRLGYLHDDQRARALALSWLGQGAPLADIGACGNDHLVVLDHVAPVFPEVVLQAIERAALVPTFADRANPNAQRFVKLLFELAYDDGSFARAADVLLKFALTERQEENNNSIVGRLRKLMSLEYSGTMATPARRQAFLRKLLASEGVRERQIAGELFRGAFDERSIGFGGSGFGARSRGPGWTPADETERRSWFAGFLALLAPVLVVDGEAREWAKLLIASHFRFLWSFAACSAELEALVVSYAAGGAWPKVWLAIGETLELDGAELDPSVLERLQVLHTLAEPTGLESEIATYALTNAWDQPGHTDEAADNALRERVFLLGGRLSEQPAVLDRLSPRIWQTRVAPLEWLGEGYAAAAAVTPVGRAKLFDQMLASFDRYAGERASMAFLTGCLRAVYRVDPDAVQSVVQDLFQVSKLRPYRASLLVATPLTDWSSEKLIDLAEDGETPAWEFEAISLGRRHEPMSDVNLERLLDALCKLERGYVSAFRILTMRLFAAKEWGYEPSPGIFAAARNALGYLLCDSGENLDRARLHGIEPMLVIALGVDAPFGQVEGLVAKLCDGMRAHRLWPSGLGAVTSAFVKACPGVLLDALFDCEVKGFSIASWLFRQRTGRMGPSLDLAPVDRLLAWAGKDSRRLLFLAQNVHIYVSASADRNNDDTKVVKLSDHFKALLDESADKNFMIEVAVDQAVPSSWMNSRIPIIEARRDALEELLSIPRAEVQTLVREKIMWLDGRIERERASEESEHHGREQRFE